MQLKLMFRCNRIVQSNLSEIILVTTLAAYLMGSNDNSGHLFIRSFLVILSLRRVSDRCIWPNKRTVVAVSAVCLFARMSVSIIYHIPNYTWLSCWLFWLLKKKSVWKA